MSLFCHRTFGPVTKLRIESERLEHIFLFEFDVIGNQAQNSVVFFLTLGCIGKYRQKTLYQTL